MSASIDMDIFDEAIELTKESVDAQMEKMKPSDDLPGEEHSESAAITIEPPTETATEVDSKPVEETAKVSDSEANEELQRSRDEAQRDWEERLEEATTAYTDASVVVMEITKELKDAKRVMKETLDEFFTLKTSGPQLPTALPLAGSKKSSSPKSKLSDVKPLDADLEKLVEQDKTWRAIPIAEVLSGVPGLGVKKYDAIAGAFANLGELEDARGQASKEFKEFKEFLPEGIGPSLADKIQERVFDLMRNHFAKIREKIAVANEASKTEPVTEAKPVDAPKPEKGGIEVSVDDALLDDSDLI